MEKKRVYSFCKKNKCCPVVEILPSDMIRLGDKPEGYTVWTKEQFKDFIEAAKKGEFDDI